jgi:signal transduction histidine kinase
VEERTEALRQLSSRLLQMQDEERRRIARELHDSAGQIVAALQMNLAQIQAIHRGSDGATLPRCISESGELMEQLSRELRTISHLLHPPLLDEAGLPSAVKWYVTDSPREAASRSAWNWLRNSGACRTPWKPRFSASCRRR